MRYTTRKGYTMTGLLLSLLILSSLMVMSLPLFSVKSTDHYHFIGDYLNAEIESYTEKRAVEIGEGLHFNRDANINVGKTLYFGDHHVIVHLANGYLSYD